MATRPSSRSGRGNVGQGDYVVKPGDCIESIAAAVGLFWEDIWNDPRNRELRETREDPNILLPGDRVSFDPPRPKQEGAETGRRHRFVRKGVPCYLELRILDLDDYRDEDAELAESEPEQQEEEEQAEPDDSGEGVPYSLVIEGRWFEGETDAEGCIRQAIPPSARTGRLILAPGTPYETEFELDLGHLDPLSEFSGVRDRLENLGFDIEGAEDEAGLGEALAAFQASQGLESTGQLDDETRARLRETHGS